MHRVRARDASARAALAVALATTAACVKQLPPAPTPQPIAPPVATGAPPAGQARLVVDVESGPAPVQRVEIGAEPIQDAIGRTSFHLVEAPHELCPASPCVLDVAPGNVMLGFPVTGDTNRFEYEIVHADPGTTVYRRALSHYEDRTGALRTMGIIGTSVGGAAAATGIVLLPIGLAKDMDGLTAAGGISLGVGAALIAFGIWAIRRDAPTFRPGASIHFAP